MSKSTGKVPKLRLHKPSGRAVVRFDGIDYYVGKFGSSESQDEYQRLLAEWIQRGHQPPRKGNGRDAEMTVGGLMIAYVEFAAGYYRKNGLPTSEYDAIRYSLRPLRLYATTSVSQFGPLALRVVQQAMVQSDLSRKEVNKRIGRIVRMFKWGVGQELVPAMIHHALAQIPGLRRGRTVAREISPIKPVANDAVEAVQSHISRQVWAMIQLQLLTGMRPGEVCQIRPCDIDRTTPTWIYTPSSHKTEHHGHERKIYLGPRAQLLLQDWLQTANDGYLFSPRAELAERSTARRAARKSRVQPSQLRRRKKKQPQRAPRERYFTASYGRAITRACCKAGIPKWHPNQLRHSVATQIRKDFGLEAASILLGHQGVGVTQVYAERNTDKALEVINQFG